MVSYQSFWPQIIICRKRKMYLTVACISDCLSNTFLNDKDFMLKIIANDVVVRPFFAKIIIWRSTKCSSLSAPWVLFCNFIFNEVFAPHHFALIVRHWIWLYQPIVFFTFPKHHQYHVCYQQFFNDQMISTSIPKLNTSSSQTKALQKLIHNHV